MRVIREKIGNHQAILTGYLHENNDEMSPERFKAVVICPGGAYYFTSHREKDPVALPFLKAGYQVFILDYSTTMLEMQHDYPDEEWSTLRSKLVPTIMTTPDVVSAFPNPLFELASVMKHLHVHADEYALNPDQIVTCGFSAGGHLVTLLGSYWNSDWLKEMVDVQGDELKPCAQIDCYGLVEITPALFDLAKQAADASLMALSKAMLNTADPTVDQLKQINCVGLASASVPPTFIWHTVEDQTVPVSQSLNFASALHAHHVPFEMHLYERGKHGLSSATADSGNREDHVSTWVDLALDWLTAYHLG